MVNKSLQQKCKHNTGIKLSKIHKLWPALRYNENASAHSGQPCVQCARAGGCSRNHENRISMKREKNQQKYTQYTSVLDFHAWSTSMNTQYLFFNAEAHGCRTHTPLCTYSGGAWVGGEGLPLAPPPPDSGSSDQLSVWSGTARERRVVCAQPQQTDGRVFAQV